MITNVLLMLAVNKFAGKIDLEDDSIVQKVRTAYIASNIIILLVYLYVRQVINRKNELTTLKYEKPKSAFSQEEPTTITTTVKAYDLEQVSAALKSVGQGVAMMAFMHLYMKYTQPLVLQSIMPLKAVYENKIVQIHLLGRKGPDYVRPFKAPTMFGDMTGEGTEEAKPEAQPAVADKKKQ